ncbi:hypothetical protein ACFQS4_07250 [Saliphagus sp. GCM10025317]
MKRRRYLSATAAGAVAGFSGCLSVFDYTVELAGVVGINHAEEPKQLEARVLDGDSEILTTEIELDAAERGDGYVLASHESVECRWSAEAKSFTVEARAAGKWQSVDVADEVDGNCAVVGLEFGHPFEPDLRFRVDPCDSIDRSSDLFCTFDESDEHNGE